MVKLLSSLGVQAAFFAAILSLAIRANAQVANGSEGNNAVWNGTEISPSTAYIDASPSYNNINQGALDICQTINGILKAAWATYPPQGAVIDARGIITASPPLPCSTNPFSGVNNTTPSTILLPGANIALTTTWTLAGGPPFFM